MITGDQALPQPTLIQGDPTLPALPNAVLRREALIRSFRWVAVAAGLAMAIYFCAVLFRLGTDVTRSWEAWLLLGGLVVVAGGAAGTLLGAAFWALSRPRPLSITILLVLTLFVMLGYLFLTEAEWSAAKSWLSVALETGRPDPAQYRIFLLKALSWLPELLLCFGVCLLMSMGPGRSVYAKENIAQFALENSPRHREHIWIGVAYGVYLAIRTWVNWHLTQ